MHLHILSQEERYIDCIEKGPHVPCRPATYVEGAVGNKKKVPKPKSEWTDEDIEQVHKDKKAMNILFNGLDGDMFDSVINCNTAKEIWDQIQVLCEGTEQVIENQMQLLIQKYESFHFEDGESLSDIFSRF
ncbi:uncharacterized protein LOC141694940 [Apium graveolens]|uniref:uncharacterized protein LOC141694940 n=1 Tax=Apium graveolens TaxID=4045 RepID=UPI003D7A21EC